ncbi:EPIDERMAL PATTERNING FACTOR-like protein 9 [Bienertia sinuspersici]
MAATMLGCVQANMLVFVVVMLVINPVNIVIARGSQSEASISNLSARRFQVKIYGKSKDQSMKRMLIGSTAPTCTYNECRGCKYRCRVEQIPVDGNDPLNSAYHYKCVCHR